MPITLEDFQKLVATVILFQHVFVLMSGILFGFLTAVLIAMGVKQ